MCLSACLSAFLNVEATAAARSDNEVELIVGNERSEIASAQENNERFNDSSRENINTQLRILDSDQRATERANLQREINQLLMENVRINREKALVLENASQRTFWIQCLIGFLMLVMLVSLSVFWRFYTDHRFQLGLSEIGDSLKQFQDSIFSFTDTNTNTQLQAESTMPSFFSHEPKVESASVISKMPGIAPRQGQDQPKSEGGFGLEPGTSIRTGTIVAPNGAQEEMKGVKGFVDAWLRVYKPGDSYVDQVAEIHAKQPKSPLGLLHKIDVHRNANDRSSYDMVRKEIKKLFNISVKPWHAMANVESSDLADYPHVIDKILQLWPSHEIELYLERLLKNSRVGPRKGFDLSVYEKIESLLTLAKDPKRPRSLQELRALPDAAFLFVPIERKVSHNSIEPMTEQAQALAPIQTPRVEKKSVVPTPIATTPPAIVPAKQTTTTGVTAKPAEQVAKVLAPAQTPIPIPIPTAAKITKPSIPDHRTNAHPEEKFLLSPYEVRLKLAVAYLEIGDSEGACLLLEDVIRDAPADQKFHAQRLLQSIEEKQVRFCGNSEDIYFN